MTARTNAARGMGMLRGRRSSAATFFHGCLISMTDNPRIIRNVTVGCAV
jgi:hypothetical protein